MEHLESPIKWMGDEIVRGVSNHLTSSLLSGRLVIMEHLESPIKWMRGN
jgi:hypothetical protein